MNTPPSDQEIAGPDPLRSEIDRVRLGMGLPAGRLRELYDYLADRTLRAEPTREADIAIDVFGRRDADALREDPVARVYVHRLRKRLDEFYLRHPELPSGLRLTIPKGDYRIHGVSAAEAESVSAEDEAGPAGPERAMEPQAPAPRPLRLLALAGAALLAVNLAGWALFGRGAGSGPGPSAIVSALGDPKRPLTVVVGDYYIFGEYEDRLFLKRLIRDFAINSKADLTTKILVDPQAHERFADVALEYLPTSAAFALADLAPVIAGRTVEVRLASELTPEALKTGDILYVGLLSGLGPLKGPMFGASRFSLGESYDQIIDQESRIRYASEAFLGAPTESMYRDYGLFSTFRGPTGNRIVILAGARDTGLMGLAEAATGAGQLRTAVRSRRDVEALFEVKGQRHVNLETRLVVEGRLDSARIWDGADTGAPTFPEQ